MLTLPTMVEAASGEGELMVEEGGRVRPWAWNGETVRSDPC